MISNEMFEIIKMRLKKLGFKYIELKHIQNTHRYRTKCSILNAWVREPGITPNVVIPITKLEDEWWVVQIGKVMYKCDQWEGVVKLIKDNNEIFKVI